MEEKLDKLITLEEENNQMLRSIIKYINYKIITANTENMNDFGRNIMANLISNGMTFK